eukprot:scaffold134438_cov84-Phaeocystis_antarctica.AAC.1
MPACERKLYSVQGRADFQLFYPPEMSEFAVAGYVSGPAASVLLPHVPPSLPPVRRYALRKDVDRTNSRGAE